MLPESFSSLLLSCVWVIVQLLFVALVSLSLYGAYHTTVFFYNQATSAVRHIPGPASQSWLYGNYKEVWTSVRLLCLPGQLYPDIVCSGIVHPVCTVGKRIWADIPIYWIVWGITGTRSHPFGY